MNQLKENTLSRYYSFSTLTHWDGKQGWNCEDTHARTHVHTCTHNLNECLHLNISTYSHHTLSKEPQQYECAACTAAETCSHP